MANIGMLYGDMYLRHAWRIILQNDINLNADIQQLIDRITQYLYSINTNRIELASNTKLVEFKPEVRSSTHVVLGFMMNIYSESTGSIAFEIRHNSELLTSVGYSVTPGWNLIAFPYFVPSLSSGVHTIQVYAITNMTGLVIEQNNLNCYLQAMSILGASDLPPSINIFDEYLYRNVNEEKVSSATNIDVINPTEANIVIVLEYNKININEVTTTVTIELL